MKTFTDSTLRILRTDGKTIGTGFLVANDLAVTCAHVVVAAEAIDGDTIQVQFTRRNEKLDALVEPKYWRHLDNGDVAFLRLKTVPDGLTPLRLGLSADSISGSPFYAFGYATAAEKQGIGARGNIITLLPDKNYLQIRAHEANHGISGAPVLDETRGVVVGMITKGHTELGRNAETTFATPAELLFEICPEIRPSETCPYLGLETFTAETAQFFFGREALTEKLVTTLRSGCRFLAVFGPSGSGKSSVVRAGLLPKLKDGLFADWKQVTMRPADNPFAQMQAAGLESLDNLTGRTLLFIDQFEELFTLCPDDVREKFIGELATALENSRFLLILSMRDDFYSAFNAKVAFLAQSDQLKIENVPGMLKRDELVAMIERPAAAVGLALEDGLTELILKDLTRDGEARSSTLPLLEFALTQLWNQRRDGQLTHAAYQSIGGVTGSLARWADEAYSDLPKSDQPLAESLLTSLVHLGDEAQGLPDTRKRRSLAEFDEPTRRVIKHFADRRLLVTGGETVELVHDALVREWGRLQDWLKKNREQLRVLEAVSEAAQTWSVAPANPDLLVHRGGRLEDALKLQNHLSVNERAYLKACELLRERVQRLERTRWIGVTSLVSVTLVLIILTLTGQLNRLIYQPRNSVWVAIPESSFWMGSSLRDVDFAYSLEPNYDTSNETPQHLVYLDAYQINKFEVTNAQYSQCIRAGICNKPVNENYARPEYENYPVTDITWQSALVFCEWQGARLPTEAEWEKAARGPAQTLQDGQIYPWGNQWDPQKANVNPGGSLKPVGSYALFGGHSAFDVADLSGNVWEWVMDWYAPNYYALSPDRNPTGPDQGDMRVIRGGSFDALPVDVRTTSRLGYLAGNTSYDLGFRCAK